MRKKSILVVAWAIAMVQPPLAAQQANAQARAHERAERVKSITEQLKIRSAEDYQRYTPQFRDKLTDEVRQLLKAQVLDSLAERESDVSLLREQLKTFLADPIWPEHSGAPYVIEATLVGVPVKVAAFELIRGGAGAPETKIFIQGFRKVGANWEFASETGDDLDGHGLFLMELKSPRANELWLLAYGVKTGSNILSLRMRVYAFDGERFTTLLSPPDRPYGQVQVEGDQIVVRSVAYDANKRRRTERYWLSMSGVFLLTSTLDGE
jgi:hypothetical protein